MQKTYKKTYKKIRTKKRSHRSMKGSGLFDDMQIGFNNMGLKANSLWGDMKTKASGLTSKMKSMFSSEPAYQPVAPAYQPVAPAYPPVAPAPQQQFVGGMPAYNSYYDKSIDHSQMVHGYQTAKPLTYVSGYGGGRNVRRVRKRRGGAPCSIADLPYSTIETGKSYANKLTGGKKRKNSRKTRKHKMQG